MKKRLDLLLIFFSEIYKELGFDKLDIKLSTRPSQRVGSDEIWDKAEQALEAAINKQGIFMKLQKEMGFLWSKNRFCS